MRISIVAPLHLPSENAYRSANRWANQARTAKVRRDVSLVLTQLPRPAAGAFYAVLVTRISAGYLDAHDGLPGACKAAVDAIADWLGVDDGDESRVRWRYAQEGCRRGECGLRIDIEDGQPGNPIERVLAGVPERIVAARKRGDRAPRSQAREPLAQARMVYGRCVAALPWEQADGPIFTDLYALVDNPPSAITIHVPVSALASGAWRAGEIVRLHRHDEHHEELGGHAYVYRIEKPKRRQDHDPERHQDPAH
jgi:hypothetical protein